MAHRIALIDNGWHLSARLSDGAPHREAITRRPALLHGVARLTRSGGQRTVKVSVPHEKGELLTAAIPQVSNPLRHCHSSAQQWTIEPRWTLLLTHLFRHWLGGKCLGPLPSSAEPLLSG